MIKKLFMKYYKQSVCSTAQSNKQEKKLSPCITAFCLPCQLNYVLCKGRERGCSGLHLSIKLLGKISKTYTITSFMSYFQEK